MASYRVTYWKDIPAMVVATDPEGTVKRGLSDRFQTLIDAVAVRLGLVDDDRYLEAWHDGEDAERAGSAAEVAAAVVAELEAQFAALRARHAGRS